MSPSVTGRVLAVSPGGRATGIAVIGRRFNLRRFEVIGVRLRGTLREKLALFRDRFDRLIDEERPDLIILERLDGGRRTNDTKEISQTVREVTALQGLPLREASLHDARAALANGQPAVRIAAHRALCQRFPQIAKYTKQPVYSKFYGYTDQYWERSFAALALAVTVGAFTGVGLLPESIPCIALHLGGCPALQGSRALATAPSS